MNGVAWVVWHDAELFKEMAKALGCPLSAVRPKFTSTLAQRVAWFTWLASINKEGDAYNMHALWLWYYRTRIQLPP